jgi:hypothetical protein
METNGAERYQCNERAAIGRRANGLRVLPRLVITLAYRPKFEGRERGEAQEPQAMQGRENRQRAIGGRTHRQGPDTAVQRIVDGQLLLAGGEVPALDDAGGGIGHHQTLGAGREHGARLGQRDIAGHLRDVDVEDRQLGELGQAED